MSLPCPSRVDVALILFRYSRNPISAAAAPEPVINAGNDRFAQAGLGAVPVPQEQNDGAANAARQQPRILLPFAEQVCCFEQQVVMVGFDGVLAPGHYDRQACPPRVPFWTERQSAAIPSTLRCGSRHLLVRSHVLSQDTCSLTALPV